MRGVAFLARLSPVEPEPSGELRQALDFLGEPVAPEQVVAAGYGLGLLAAIKALLVVIVWPGRLGRPALIALFVPVLLVIHAVHSLPLLLARARESRALGEGPDLVMRAVLSVRLSPSPERAAEFAAETADGPLARALQGHVRRASLGEGNALGAFGSEWGGRFPALERALSLVSTAAAMPERDRQRTLDRALSVVLEGTRTEMEIFANRIRGPVTALYAFGVLLPTALVALLPAAGMAGIGVTTATVILVYDLLLPATLTLAALWLVVRRPVAFPPPKVDRSHPDVPERRLTAPLAGILLGAIAWALGRGYLPPWGAPVLGFGIGTGVTLFAYFRPVLAVYERVYAVEDGLTDALSLVGQSVARGNAVETAIQQAAGELDGEIATVFRAVTRQQRQLKSSVEEAFLGEHGALADLPSPRIRGSAAILGLAATEGRPVGDALLTLADHVEDLQRVESRAQRDLESITGTLMSTGEFFGPMVAGATIALADGMGASDATVQHIAGSLQGLGFAVGGYVLACAVILPALATSLTRGFDRALVGARVGRALAVATIVYPVSYLVVVGLI
jgi:Flp pilus assembly protein TadB